MKLKPKVVVNERDHPYTLSLNGVTKVVCEKDVCLMNSIRQGNIETEDLKILIMKQEESNEILAGLTLADFILKYQYFLDGKEHITIT